MAQVESIIKPTRRMILWFSPVALVIFVGVLLSVLYQPQFARAIMLATTHQPETYTELYFASTSLPRNVKVNVPAVTYFHITNHEAGTKVYQYTVTQTVRTVSTVISRGSVKLDVGEGADRSIRFVLHDPRTTAQIRINLNGSDQEIDFRSQS